MSKKMKKYEQLELTDDFMFSKIMRNKELCKKLLELILDTKISDLVYLESQKTIDLAADAKGIRLDVYLADESHTVYDVEMQSENRYNLPKRSRYYSGIIDLDMLEKGMNYNELNQSYIIFICTFDIFGEGRHVYTFENICKENSDLFLRDGTTKIFLNANGKEDDVSEDMKAFLHYLAGEKPDNAFVARIDEAVEQARLNRKWRREYMLYDLKYRDILEEGREEGRNEGQAVGIEKGIEKGIKKGKAIGIKTLIETCMELETSEDYIIEKLIKNYALSRKEAESYLEQYKI